MIIRRLHATLLILSIWRYNLGLSVLPSIAIASYIVVNIPKTQKVFCEKSGTWGTSTNALCRVKCCWTHNYRGHLYVPCLDKTKGHDKATPGSTNPKNVKKKWVV